MLTDEDLPPIPKFSVTHWMFTGITAWSLFFGAVGGLGVLLLADYGPEKVSPTRQLKENVVAVNDRVSALEQRTQKLQAKQLATPQPTDAPASSSVDTQLARILAGLTQLKTAYDNDMPLQPGIETLKTSIKDADIQASLTKLQKLTSDNFPSKEKIMNDLQVLQNQNQSPQSGNNTNNNNPNNNSNATWKERAKAAMSQLVTVTPTKNIANNQQITRVQQAVAGGDFNLAEKFAAQLPDTSGVQNLVSEIKARSSAQSLVQEVISRASSAIGKATGQGSLY